MVILYYMVIIYLSNIFKVLCFHESKELKNRFLYGNLHFVQYKDTNDNLHYLANLGS